jgi:hypothetical protein
MCRKTDTYPNDVPESETQSPFMVFGFLRVLERVQSPEVTPERIREDMNHLFEVMPVEVLARLMQLESEREQTRPRVQRTREQTETLRNIRSSQQTPVQESSQVRLNRDILYMRLREPEYTSPPMEQIEGRALRLREPEYINEMRNEYINMYPLQQ